jgi:CHAT domain-containing protein
LETYRTDFQVTRFETLPRDIEALRKELGQGGTPPGNCPEIRRRKAERISVLKETKEKSAADGMLISLGIEVEKVQASGDFEVARDLIEFGLRTTESSEFWFSTKSAHRIRFLSYLVTLDTALGDADSAAANASSLTLGDAGFTQKIYYHLITGSVAKAQGKFTLAEQQFRKALQAVSSSGDIRDYVNVSAVYESLVWLLVKQDRLIEAEGLAREAIERIGLGRQARYFGKAIHETDYYSGYNSGPFSMMALVLLEQGRLADALYMARMAINMHEVGCSDPRSLGLNRARAVLVRILAEGGNWTAVLRHIETAKKDLVDLPDVFERTFGSSLDHAEAQIYAGDPSVGRKILKGKIEESRRQAQDPGVSEALAMGVLSLADTAAGNHDKSIAGYFTAFEVLTAPENAGNVARLSTARVARVFRGYLSTLLAVSGGRTSKVGNVQPVKEMFRVSSALKHQRVHQAFNAARTRAALRDPVLSDLARKEQDSRIEYEQLVEILAQANFLPKDQTEALPVAKINKRLAFLRKVNQAALERITARFPKYAELITPPPITVEEIQANLKPRQVLISYFVLDDQVFVWAIPKQDSIGFAKAGVGTARLARMIKRLRKGVDPQFVSTLGDIPQYDVELAHEIYSALLEPVSRTFKGASELLVVPDDVIGSLPFAILARSGISATKDREIPFDRYRGVEWLARDFAVLQLPSDGSIKRFSRDTAGGRSIEREAFFGVGDPFFNTGQYEEARRSATLRRNAAFRAALQTRGATTDRVRIEALPRLPDTRDEILGIAEVLNVNPEKNTLFGQRASESVVTKKDLRPYKIISFATHGLAAGDLDGLFEPALAFSSPEVTGEKEDGLLTMTEVLELELFADLVVLSACNTAAGDNRTVEALSGLGRAFFYAGAQSVLVSNWPVSSSATKNMMVRIFENRIKSTDLSLAEIYRKTQIQMIDEMTSRSEPPYSYAHPIFWGPFTLAGNE